MDEKKSKNDFHENLFHIFIVQTIYFVANMNLGVNERCQKLTLGGSKSEVVLLSSHGMDVEIVQVSDGGHYEKNLICSTTNTIIGHLIIVI